jgi:hypothetical protein
MSAYSTALEHKRVPRDVGNTLGLDGLPRGLANVSSSLLEIVGRDLPGPVGLDGLFDLTEFTYEESIYA